MSDLKLSKQFPKPSQNAPARYISHMIGAENYTIFYFIDDSSVVYASTLKNFEKKYPEFVRLHKKILYRKDLIIGYRKLSRDDMEVAVVGGAVHKIPRRRIADLLKICQTLPSNIYE